MLSPYQIHRNLNISNCMTLSMEVDVGIGKLFVVCPKTGKRGERFKRDIQLR